MALTLTSASTVVGAETRDILQISPDPTADIQPIIGYNRQTQTTNFTRYMYPPLPDRPSTLDMFGNAFTASNGGLTNMNGFFFGDEDFTRTVRSAGTGTLGKITGITSTGGASPAYTTATTVPYIRDVRNAIALSRGPALFNASAAWLGTWFYPTPTHLLFPSISGGPYAMTSVAPTITKAYLQCQPYHISQASNDSSVSFNLGQYGPSGSRLSLNNSGSIYKVGSTETRYRTWGWTNGAVIWGAFPDLEVCGYAFFSKTAGVGSFPTATIETTQTKLALDGTSATTALSSVGLPATSSYTIGGTDYQECILQPTSSSPGSPDADTMSMNYSSAVNWTGGSGFSMVTNSANNWHKNACYWNGWAFSHGSGDNAYLPGWIFDMS